ncbi:MAG: LexA family transcriptional regulator [Clostridiales bacterium]|nr:LexA family transcriptional regulator [Clostridiales bacterium]
MFPENVRALMEERGINKRELSLGSGIPYTTIDGWFKKGGDNVHLGTLLRLAEYFNVSLDSLAGTDGGMTPAEQLMLGRWRRLDEHGQRMVKLTLNEEYARCAAEKEKEQEAEQRFIPHYTTMAAAGYANPIENEDFNYIPVTGEVPENAQFAVTISGDSMEPYIHDGQTVYCVKDAQGVHPGEIGIFCVDGAYYCKQYATSGYDTYLLSLNREREDADIAIYGSGNRSLTCAGRVIMDKKIPIV